MPGQWEWAAMTVHVPEALLAGGPIGLDAGALGRFEIAEPGAHELTLGAGSGAVVCLLSRALPPSPQDPRELGIIVTEVRTR
jgi:hypothetical protein